MSKKQPEALRQAAWLKKEGASCQRHYDLGVLIERQHTELETLRTGYAAARLEIESLKSQLAAEPPAPRGEPVAWLCPWRADQVTTDYDAYGEHGIALYTAPQPSPTAHAAESVPAVLGDDELVMLGKSPESGLPPWGIGTTRADYLRAVRAVLAAARAPADSVLEDAARYRWLFGARTEAQAASVPETVFKPLPQDEVLSHLQGFYMSKPEVDALVEAAIKQGENHDNS